MGDKVTIIDTAERKSRLESFLKSFSISFDVIASRLGPVSKERNIYQAIIDLKTEVTSGFAAVAAEIAKLQTPVPPPAQTPLEVKFMFVVKDDHPSEPFSIVLGEVKDAEGNVIPDAQVDVAVKSSNETAVAVSFDPATRAGSANFVNPGVAALSAEVSSNGVLLGTGAVDFTVTVGDPASISSVGISFPNLTEAPPAPIA
jgi:hypothetical protein